MAEIQIDSADIFKMMSKPPFEEKEVKQKSGKLRITNDGSAITKIYIDDVKIDKVFGYKLSQNVGEVPTVEINRFAYDGEVEIDNPLIIINKFYGIDDGIGIGDIQGNDRFDLDSFTAGFKAGYEKAKLGII